MDELEVLTHRAEAVEDERQACYDVADRYRAREVEEERRLASGRPEVHAAGLSLMKCRARQEAALQIAELIRARGGEIV